MALKPKFSVETNGRRNVTSSETRGADIFHALLSLLLLICVAPGLFAQGLSGSTLRGVVKDASGGLVANATVKLISTKSGAERQVKTNDEGAYVFTSVEPGPYSLRVEAAGFKAHEQTEFMLAPSDTKNLDVALEVVPHNVCHPLSGRVVAARVPLPTLPGSVVHGVAQRL